MGTESMEFGSRQSLLTCRMVVAVVWVHVLARCTVTFPSLPGRYACGTILGAGGSGRVFRVRDSARDIDLALKIVDPTESVWLRREFDTLRQIRHENLIQVFDWGSLPSGEAFFTMELIDGTDWGSQLEIPQPVDEVRRILAAILRALAHLHSHGEIHGDLKPGNVLLGRGGVVKVADVGMGGSVSGSPGTPGYAAPEVWEGSKADVRSDVYSAGVMAYEALTGRHPFAGRTIREVISGQLEGWVPSPAAHGVRVPADLEIAVMRALERVPTLRQGSADEVMEGISIIEQVGEITGGRIVGRDRELAQLGQIIEGITPQSPTVVYVSGPPGTGKSALIEECGQRALALGGNYTRVRAATTGSLERALRALHSHEREPMAEASREVGLSAIAETMAAVAEGSPLVVAFEAASNDMKRVVALVRALGRFLWALSVEKSRSLRVVLLSETPDPPTDLLDFERTIGLSALDQTQVADFIAGTLGRADLEPEVLTRLGAITGGSPRALRALITDLADRHLLQRIAGVWRFREAESLSDLSMLGAASRWTLAWGHLMEEQRSLLALLSRFPSGLTLKSLQAAIPRSVDLVPDLAARGWIRHIGRREVLASDEILTAVADVVGSGATRPAEERLLRLNDADLSREERASILLRIGSPKDAIREGFWAAQQSMSRGDYRQASVRAERCVELGRVLEDADAVRRGALMAAEALHQMGDHDAASRQLEASGDWDSQREMPVEMAEKEHLLGVIRRSQGNLVEASAHLGRAIDLSERGGDISTSLRAHADLAEIEWRHGDQAARNSAMERVRTVLNRQLGGSVLKEERAALSYQLGSALILSGEREEARKVLTTTLNLQPGDYWRMRLAIALAAACYYLGGFQDGLDWMDEAWRCAERGGFDAFKARIYSNRAGILYGLGRFREAVDQHELSARWGRRTGNTFEFLTAREGASVNLTLLSRYEEAIVRAREAYNAADQIGSTHESAKARELEALACYYIGSYGESSRILQEAAERTRETGFDDVKPRLAWLQARLCIESGDLEAAEQLLREALEVLSRTKDWEDLPGVQIEMQLVLFRRMNPRFSLEEVRRLSLEAERARALIVYLRGALVVGEVVVAHRINDRELHDLLLNALARAEESGTAEIAWRLSFTLGELAMRERDMRGASGRFAHAVRRFGEIADRLLPEHRKHYLNTAHALHLLDRAFAIAPTG